MRRMGRWIGGVALILATTCLMGFAAPSALAGSRQPDVYRHQMLAATNDSRVVHHKGRLSLDDRMSALAERHSAQMAKAGYLFHTSNVGAYLSDTPWHAWGENIGYMPGGNVSDLQKAFMRSPVHRDNILNGAFRHVAIGTVYQGGTLWVTVFFYG